MNKNIFVLIFCLMGSMPSQSMFQGFFSTCDFMKKSVISIPVVFASYIKKTNDLSINSTIEKRNSFLAQPMSDKQETISTARSKRRSEVDLAQNRTKKENLYKNKPNPALNELLAYSFKYGHKEYWYDVNNTGQSNLYKYASNASNLKPRVNIDFSKIDLSACSKGPKVEKFKDQSKARFAFPQIEKFAVKKAFNPEKTLDLSVYTDESRPCAQAENYL